MRTLPGSTKVPVAGTRVQVAPGNMPRLRIKGAWFGARPTNVGVIYLGDSLVSSSGGLTLSPGATWTISWGNGSDTAGLWYVDAATSSDIADWVLIFEE